MPTFEYDPIMTAAEKAKERARSEGIVFDVGGAPLFARDLPRWREILSAPEAADTSWRSWARYAVRR